jgi:hypothetical protein
MQIRAVEAGYEKMAIVHKGVTNSRVCKIHD